MHFNLQLQQQRQEPNNWHPRQQWRTTMVLGAVRCCWNFTLLFGMIILELPSQLTSQLTSQLASQFLHIPLQLMSSCGRVAAYWGNLAEFRTNVVWLPAKCCSNKHDLQILLLLELFIFHIVVSGFVVVIVAAGAWQCSNDANHVNIHSFLFASISAIIEFLCIGKDFLSENLLKFTKQWQTKVVEWDGGFAETRFPFPKKRNRK